MELLKRNSGFGLVEVLLSLTLVGGLSLMIGHGLATQKKHEVDMTNKLGLTTVVENVVGRLNSTTVMSNQFNKIFETVLPPKGELPSTTAERAFSDCIQKKVATTNCETYETGAFPNPAIVEDTPVGRGITLRTTWTSSIRCEATFCSSYLVTVNLNLIGNAAAQDTDEYKIMQLQLAKMASSKQREYPILSLVTKSDMSYQCARDANGNPRLVLGLDSDQASAACGEMVGQSSCVDDGKKPLKSFGGETTANVCEPLVQVKGCTEGVGKGSLFQISDPNGGCKARAGGDIKSYVKNDPDTGRPISAVICGPGNQCVTIGVASRYEGGRVDIEYELQNSDAYNQLMTTWRTEGTLVPAKNLNVNALDPSRVTFDSIYGGGIPGADHLTISLMPNYVPPVGQTPIAAAYGAPGGNVDPGIFQEGADPTVVVDPHPIAANPTGGGAPSGPVGTPGCPKCVGR